MPSTSDPAQISDDFSGAFDGHEDLMQQLATLTGGSHCVAGRAHGDDTLLGVFDTDAAAAIIDEAKRRGLVDSALATDSIVLLCQALALGAHALRRIGREEEGWDALIERILAAFAPPHQ